MSEAEKNKHTQNTEHIKMWNILNHLSYFNSKSCCHASTYTHHQNHHHPLFARINQFDWYISYAIFIVCDFSDCLSFALAKIIDFKTKPMTLHSYRLCITRRILRSYQILFHFSSKFAVRFDFYPIKNTKIQSNDCFIFIVNCSISFHLNVGCVFFCFFLSTLNGQFRIRFATHTFFSFTEIFTHTFLPRKFSTIQFSYQIW